MSNHLVFGLAFLLYALMFVPWGVWRLKQPLRYEDKEWEQRHPLLTLLLADSWLWFRPVSIETAGAQSCVLSGTFALAVSTFILLK